VANKYLKGEKLKEIVNLLRAYETLITRNMTQRASGMKKIRY
jgi:hypothetical protein